MITTNPSLRLLSEIAGQTSTPFRPARIAEHVKLPKKEHPKLVCHTPKKCQCHKH